MFIQQAKKAIDKHAVISFDIFDTLLLRPYLRPADLFIHLERLHHLPGWAQRRKQAEQQARRELAPAQDITYDEIYTRLSGPDAALKQAELSLERQTLQPNKQITELFAYAKKQGKQIILVSDMYLPSDFLENVLKEKGIVGFSKLYISNQFRKTKASGDLYRHVQQELGINPQNILHIGDNLQADTKRARQAGWDSLPYTALFKQYLQTHPRQHKLWKQNPCYDFSVLLALMALHQMHNETTAYFPQLGYEIGGPAAYGFMRWLYQKAQENHTSHLLFTARDGYTLLRVFNTFPATGIKASYIYAPRFLNRICHLDYEPKNTEQMGAIIEYFSGKSASLAAALPKGSLSREKMQQFLQQHKDTFSALAKQELAHFRELFTRYTEPPYQIGIVDSVTSSFSAQKLIASCFGKENTCGYYWAASTKEPTGAWRFEHYRPNTNRTEDHVSLTHHWEFMEFLFTAPEPPIRQITPEGRPVYTHAITAQEKQRTAIYPLVSDAMTAFAQDVQHLFVGQDLCLEADRVVAWINHFLLHPTSTDQKEMSVLFHAADTAHNKYVPLLSYRPGSKEIFQHPAQYFRFAKKVYWKTLPQWLWACLMSPASLEKYSSEQRTLCLLPTLRKQYFKWGIQIKNRFYGIALGRKGD